MPFHFLCWVVLLLGLVAMTCQTSAAPGAGGGGAETIAEHAIVATTHPLAVRIGVEILKQGGNAVDAAIATNAAMGLMEPMSCGVGGDLFAIVWDAKSQKLYGLNASGRSPYRATREFFAGKGLKEIPTSGPLSWSVPGCVDGWAELAKRFGTMPLDRLLEPSIKYAEEGVAVPPTIGGFWRMAERKLSRYPDSAQTYLPGGKAPRVGELFKNPRLAETYRRIAAGGRDAFYRGQIAKDIVAFSDSHGGLFSMRDFAEHTSVWVEPVSGSYRGYEVWELPPPGQGIAVLQMLNILEGYDLKAMGSASADWWHVLIEAKKLAYADRAKFYADPEFAKAPTAQLISKPYAAKRRELIDMHGAAEDVEPGDVKIGQSDTIYLCVVDKDRNCVSLIQSNYSGFGSGLVPGDLGFILQNRGTLFALDPAHANTLEPHKHPFHTIIPAMVTKEGKPYFVFGVMGGDMQPQVQVQVLVNLLDFGMDVYAAGAAPRVEHLYSATPTGRLAHGSGTVEAEPGVPEAAVLELERRGHHVVRVRKNGGGYEGILIDGSRLRGGSEARRDGVAEGY
jgi:gamma-glutamyltranspeptidase/glutathione hydrolase